MTIFIGYGKNEMPVGNLELGNNVRVSDPCYSPDTWCSNVVCGFKPGTYHAYVQKEDEENRVAELIVYHEDYDTDEKKSNMFWRDYCIDVAVDSGQAGFFDETYYVTAKAQEEKVSAGMPETGFYRDCCNITLADDPYGILNNQKGVVSESGYGDGCYTMYAAKDSDGYIIAAKISFIDLGEENDWYDDEDEDECEEEEEDNE